MSECYGFPAEKTCAVCGKKFLAREDYVYKKGRDSHRVWYCSWHCLRSVEKEKEPKCKHSREIIAMLKEGKRAREISETLWVNLGMVYYYDRKCGGL